MGPAAQETALGFGSLSGETNGAYIREWRNTMHAILEQRTDQRPTLTLGRREPRPPTGQPPASSASMDWSQWNG